MTEETQEEQVTEEAVEQAENVDQSVEQPVEAPENPDWLQTKYLAEGKTTEESIAEQAKAYTELHGKFGAFTGAPDSYEITLSDELKEMGIDIASDDPMMVAAQEYAKESNMSQEGLNGLVNIYAMQQVADQKAIENYKSDQMKELGTNADSRVQNIQQWASANLDTETVAGLEGFANNAGAVKALEQIIKLTGATSVDADETTTNAGASAEEVQKMQFELDSNGNRRLQTDPEFKARFNKMRNEVYGTSDHNVIIG